MHACDIRQYLIRQNVLCTISPNITLANISSYTVSSFHGNIIILPNTTVAMLHKSVCKIDTNSRDTFLKQ